MKGLLTAAALSAALGLLVLTAMSSANANDRYMTLGDAETMAGRNDRVSHPRTILHNGLLLSLKHKGKQIPVKLNAGSINRESASVAIRKVNKGYNFKLLLTATTLKARWVDADGQAQRVSLLFNGKGHH